MRLIHLSVAESILSMMRWRTKRLSWNWAGWEKVPNYHSKLSLLLLLTLLFMWSLASKDCHCVIKVTPLKTLFFFASCQLQMDAMSLFPKMSERKQRNMPRWDTVGHRRVVQRKHSDWDAAFLFQDSLEEEDDSDEDNMWTWICGFFYISDL